MKYVFICNQEVMGLLQNCVTMWVSRIDITKKSLNMLRCFDPVFENTKQNINYLEMVSEFKDIIVELATTTSYP